MKILRAYIITAVVCLSITSSLCAMLIADENAKKITLGQEAAVLVFESKDKSLHPHSVNPLPALGILKEGAEKAAGIAPPPISNIYWFAVNSERIMS